MALKPLGDRVVIKQADADVTSPGGIVIPDNAKEKPTKGEVLAVGPGRVSEDGKVIPMTVKVGDVVLYEKYAGSEVKLDNDKTVVVRESEILAVLN